MQQRGTWRVLGTGQGPEARAPGNAVWPLIPAGVPAGHDCEDRNRAGMRPPRGFQVEQGPSP